MSNWTHVAGIVRLNNLLLAMVNPEKLRSVNVLRELHGQDPRDPEQEFIDKVLECFNEDIPGGSEGPLKIALYVWPTSEDFDVAGGTTHLYKGGLYWADVIISGDLRDVDEPSKITHWLNQITLPDGVGIRDGALYTYSEAEKAIVMYNGGEGWTIKSIVFPEELE